MPTWQAQIDELRRLIQELHKRVSFLENHRIPALEAHHGEPPEPEPEPEPTPEPEPEPTPPDPEPEPEPPPPIPVPPGDHGYFNALMARPEHVLSYSLRDQAQIDQHSKKGPQDPVTQDSYVEYDAEADAARVQFKAGLDESLDNQVELPVPVTTNVIGDRYLLTWDFWLGQSFVDEGPPNGLLRHKMFKLICDHLDKGRVGYVNFTHGYNTHQWDYKLLGSAANGFHTNPSTINRNHLVADGLAIGWAQAYDTWTRLWIEIRRGDGPNAPDQVTDTITIWAADETRDPVRVLDGLRYTYPWNPHTARGLHIFNLHFNSSQEKTGGGAMTAYVRNVAMLMNADPTPLLIRP